MKERQISLELEARGGGVIARLFIDNPARLNSMNSALMVEFVEAVEGLKAVGDLRALIVTGAGDKAFVGGADIKEMGQVTSPDGARAFITRVHPIFGDSKVGILF